VPHAAIPRGCHGERTSGFEFDEQLSESRIQARFPITWGDANWALITLFQDMGTRKSRIQASKLFQPPLLDGLHLQNARRRHSEGVISRWNFCCGLYLCQWVLQPEALSH
jgi:hypothetical protein